MDDVMSEVGVNGGGPGLRIGPQVTVDPYALVGHINNVAWHRGDVFEQVGNAVRMNYGDAGFMRFGELYDHAAA